MVGRVVSTKSKGTVTVLVDRRVTHPLYKKVYLRTKKYLVDDAIGVKDGDIVNIEKCKPVSKRKHWKVTKVLGANLAEIVEAEQKVKAAEEIAQVMPASQGERGEPEEKKIEEPSAISTQTEKEIDEKQKKPRKKKGRSES